jgi:hypothetical protein
MQGRIYCALNLSFEFGNRRLNLIHIIYTNAAMKAAVRTALIKSRS